MKNETVGSERDGRPRIEGTGSAGGKYKWAGFDAKWSFVLIRSRILSKKSAFFAFFRFFFRSCKIHSGAPENPPPQQTSSAQGVKVHRKATEIRKSANPSGPCSVTFIFTRLLRTQIHARSHACFHVCSTTLKRSSLPMKKNYNWRNTSGRGPKIFAEVEKNFPGSGKFSRKF